MKKSLILIFFVCFLSLLSCSVDSSSLTDIFDFDIKDAKKLLKINNSTANKLYKMTVNKICEKIDPPDIINDYGVLHTFNINDEYVIITYSYNNYPYPEAGYIVSKITGKGYSLENVGFPRKEYEGEKVIQVNGNNVYYRTYDSSIQYDTGFIARVVRITISDPNNLTAEYTTSDIDDIRYFVVANDNIAYSGSLAGSSGLTKVNRLKLNNGGLVNLPSITADYGYSIGSYFIDFNENIFFYNVNTNRYQKILIDVNYNVSYDDYITNVTQSPGFFIPISNNSSIYRITSSLNEMYEVFNSTYTSSNSALQYNFLSVLNSVKHISYSDEYIYISGYDASSNSIITQFNPASQTFNEIINTALYDFYTISVDNEENITFSALRMSDGKKVIGSLQTNGTIEINNEVINSQALSIEELYK